MAAGPSTSHILQSLLVNIAIAVGKGFAAALTGSGAMLAETLHSAADCGNQVLLLVGVRRAGRAPDAMHPLGYGRELYFWSFMVALLLFTGGGVFSIYEGLLKVRAPEPIENVWVGLAVLGLSLVLEGGATVSNVKEMNRRRGAVSFFRYLRETKDSDLIVVFGENAAASLGLVVASAALSMAHVTEDGRWDGLGTMAIGLILIGVAVFLAVEVKSLLLGERADASVESAVRDVAAAQPEVVRVLHLITVQQGPSEVLVAVKMGFRPELGSHEVCRAIDAFEDALRARCPEVRWCFVEPDVPRDPEAVRAPDVPLPSA